MHSIGLRMRLYWYIASPDTMRTSVTILLSFSSFLSTFYRFLDLMASTPGLFLVPTLDIDLAWHTHQMKAEIYQADCMKYIGRYVDQSVLSFIFI